jgi:hypothetical protein
LITVVYFNRVRAAARDAGGAEIAGAGVERVSSDQSVATITGAGIIRAIAPGDVTISAVRDGVTNAFRIRVLPESIRAPESPVPIQREPPPAVEIRRETPPAPVGGGAPAYTDDRTVVGGGDAATPSRAAAYDPTIVAGAGTTAPPDRPTYAPPTPVPATDPTGATDAGTPPPRVRPRLTPTGLAAGAATESGAGTATTTPPAPTSPAPPDPAPLPRPEPGPPARTVLDVATERLARLSELGIARLSALAPVIRRRPALISLGAGAIVLALWLAVTSDGESGTTNPPVDSLRPRPESLVVVTPPDSSGRSGGRDSLTGAGPGPDSVVGPALVDSAPTIGSLEIVPPAGILNVGGRRRLAIRARDTNGRTMRDVAASWRSEDPQLLRVNARTGEVTALAPGNATIVAEAGELSAVIQLSVARPEPPPDPETPPPTKNPTYPPPRDSTIRAPDPDRPRNEGSAAAVAAVRGTITEYIQALGRRDAATIERLYVTESNQDVDNRRALSRLMTTSAWRMAVADQRLEPPVINGDRATTEFSVRLTWRNNFGGSREAWVPFRAELERQYGTWRITAARMVGTPNIR